MLVRIQTSSPASNDNTSIMKAEFMENNDDRDIFVYEDIDLLL